MKRLAAYAILSAAFGLPAGAAYAQADNAVDDTVIYQTRDECRAALAEVRKTDASYLKRECRPEGEGWSFRPKDGAGKKRPDGTKDPGH
jgi:hypothetical protein